MRACKPYLPSQPTEGYTAGKVIPKAGLYAIPSEYEPSSFPSRQRRIQSLSIPATAKRISKKAHIAILLNFCNFFFKLWIYIPVSVSIKLDDIKILRKKDMKVFLIFYTQCFRFTILFSRISLNICIILQKRQIPFVNTFISVFLNCFIDIN